MITKKTAFISISGVLSAVGLLTWFAFQLEFDYEFENFFPLDDPSLLEYREFSKKFGNDNDYLLIGIEDTVGLFREEFLGKVKSLHEQLGALQGTIDRYSLINAQNPVETPLGVVGIPVLHANDTSKYSSDSLRLSRDTFTRSFFISKTMKGTKILVLHERFITKEAADQFVQQVEDIVQQHRFHEYHIAGKAKAQKVFIELIRNDFQKFLIISMVIVIITLSVIIRRPLLVLTILLICVFSVLAILGIMAVTGKNVDILSTLIPPILLIVAMSDIIHLYSRTRDLQQEGSHIFQAIQLSIKEVGFATLLTSVTTMIGFLTLTTIQVGPIRDLGLYTAAGVLVAFIITYLVFPQILVLTNAQLSLKSSKPTVSSIYDRLFLLVFKNQKLTVGCFTAFMLVLLWGVSLVRVNAYLIDDIPRELPLQRDFVYFNDNFGGSKPFVISMQLDSAVNGFFDEDIIKTIASVEESVSSEFGITNLISPATYVKLANKTIHGGNSDFYKLPENAKDWHSSLKLLKKYRPEEKFMSVTNGKMARIYGFVPDEGSYTSTLHYQWFDRFIDKHHQNGPVKFRLTGTSYLIDRSNELLSLNLIKGIGIAILLVGIVSGLLFRSLRMVLITLVPNMFPVIAVGAIMGYFGIDLKMSTSIIFAISFGIAVDDTIHFIAKFRAEKLRGTPRLIALKNTMKQTGKPIVTTTFILSAGFLVFCVSSFGATFYTGLFVGVSFIIALLADLLLLPILIWNIYPRK